MSVVRCDIAFGPAFLCKSIVDIPVVVIRRSIKIERVTDHPDWTTVKVGT